MKKQSLFLALLGILMVQLGFAQQKTITGNITDESGLPLPGATVVIENTTRGVTSDFDGNFSIQASEGDVLVVSYVGYSDQRINVGTQNNLSIGLTPDNELEEVVVTALGITRDKKSLGYAQQTVAGENLAQTREADLNITIAGKVAGIQIIGGSSSNFDNGFIRLRGETDVLYVVDGIKVYSQNNINTDNIESMSVLKGAVATALYGAEAKNGVVIIASKKAGVNEKTFSINHGTSFSNVSILPEYQNEYGGGYDQEWDLFEYNPATDPASWAAFDGHKIPYYAADESWGPRLDGTLVRHWDSWIPNHPEFGKLRPWEPNPDNVRNFFNTGINNITNLSFAKGGEDFNVRATLRNINQTLVIPNTEKNQIDASVAMTYDFTDKVNFYSSINYQYVQISGRPLNGYGGLGANFNQWWQRQLDIDRLKNNYLFEGNFYSWNSKSARDPKPLYWNAPHFDPEQNKNVNRNDTSFGNLGMNYNITENLMANVELRRRYNGFYGNSRTAFGGLDVTQYNEYVNRFVQNEMFALLTYQNEISDQLDLDVKLGYQIQQNRLNFFSASSVGGLSVPNLYTVASSVDRPNVNSFTQQSKLQSNFVTFSLGYNDLVYLDGSYRLDWSSTANTENNRLDTSGFSLSFLFSELIDSKNILSLGKLRGGYSEAPIFPNPYATGTTYSVGSPYGSNPTFSVPNTQANKNLLGGERQEIEIGLELNFWNSLLGLDITYFDRTDKKLPFSIPIPGSTGYSGLSINSRETSSNGIEISILAKPVKTKDFKWDTTLNFATLTKSVDFIYEDTTKNILDSWVSWGGLQLQEVVGEEWGVFVGRKRKKDNNGNYILSEDGVYQYDANQVLGSLLPDFTGGFYNNFSYKNLKLNIGIDFQKGGLFYSTTNMFNYYSGLHRDTAGLNDKGNPKRDPIDQGGGVHVVGVTESGAPVDVYREASSWAGGFFGLHDEWLYDASFIKLRQLALGYTLPSHIIEKTPFSSIDMSIIGNNLSLLYSNIKHGGLDPSEIEGNGSIASEFRNVEGGQLPPTRSIGLNFNIKF